MRFLKKINYSCISELPGLFKLEFSIELAQQSFNFACVGIIDVANAFANHICCVEDITLPGQVCLHQDQCQHLS